MGVDDWLRTSSGAVWAYDDSPLTTAADRATSHPSEIQFTEAIRPRTGKQVPVCIKCQEKYGQNQFPEGTLFDPLGRWGN